jgi:hypothetical protein
MEAMIEWQSLIQWALGLVIVGIASGLTIIAKILLGQNKALAILVERVGTVNVESLVNRVSALEEGRKNSDAKVEKLDAAHESKLARLSALEADMARVWQIYDLWTGNRSRESNVMAQGGTQQ